jgi:hypothetical protein
MTGSASSITRIEGASGVLVRIAGSIDETLAVDQLTAETADRRIVVFDLQGVSRITSFGIREWATVIAELRADYYCFIRCQPAIVSQFNLIDSFAGRGELVSLFAPYQCPACGEEDQRLIDLRHDYDAVAALTLPTIPCKCGGAAEFDDVPEIYFQYVLSVPAPAPPAAANEIIDGSASTATRRAFSMRKRIQGAVTEFALSGYLGRAGHFKRAAEGVDGAVVLLCSDLEGAAEEGLSDLSRFLRTPNLRPWLARITPGLFDILDRVIHEPALEAKIASLLLPFYCGPCDTRLELDIDRAALASLGDPAAPRPACPQCGGDLARSFSPEVAEAARRLPLADAAEEVRTHLRQNPPVDRRGTGDKRTAPRGPTGLILGKYRVTRILGKGGMGQVFLARHVGPDQFEKLVVLKRIHRDIAGDPHSLQAFLDEARISARLSHPNIVHIFDLGRFEGEYYIAMEYIDGIDLHDALARTRKNKRVWPLDICCRVVSDLCAALHAAHSFTDPDGRPSPIIHRDVSPSNVLLSMAGAVKLTDFGIAKANDSRAITQPGVFKGKSAYAPPEQILGNTDTVDPRMDVYAVGVVLHECLTHKRLFRTPVGGDGDRPLVLAQAPLLLAETRPDVPPVLEAAVRKATALDPAQRYASVRELRADLETVLQQGRYATMEDLAAWIGEIVTLPTGARAAECKEKSATTDLTGGDGVADTADHTETGARATPSVTGKR